MHNVHYFSIHIFFFAIFVIFRSGLSHIPALRILLVPVFLILTNLFAKQGVAKSEHFPVQMHTIKKSESHSARYGNCNSPCPRHKNPPDRIILTGGAIILTGYSQHRGSVIIPAAYRISFRS